MNSKVDALFARIQGASAKGSKSMWYMLFANAVADRLCETETITHAEMQGIFERRLNEVRGSLEADVLVPGYEECIARLEAFSASNTPTNGYEPTGA